jgi:hypothetical protein
MKPPRDTISQRELILRYRILIDEAAHIPVDKRKTARIDKAKARILTLAKENPNSTMSKHVMWNIGKAKRLWLLDFLEKEGPEWTPGAGT